MASTRSGSLLAFNTAEGWSRDITEDVGRDIFGARRPEGRTVDGCSQSFVEWAAGEDVPLTLCAEI
jgi:hypothetical protein